ncbi:MAG TPA: OmpA family protein [Gemmatimonadales bacterium]|nr:OmpA family protein [Gemmatimonadales bacterium]
MRTYRFPAGGVARALRLLGILVLSLLHFTTGQAQERRYLFEVSAAGAYQSFGSTTDLGGAVGGLGRLGLWLPLNFSVEAEGSIASPKAETANVDVKVKTGSVSLLYNVLFGPGSSGYAKFGIGGTRYGGDCATPGARICGTTTTLVGGVGVRVGLTPVVMLRAEGAIHPNRGTTEIPGPTPSKESIKFTNYSLNVGLSLMLGSKPIPDSDGDGVQNNRDRCPNTPPGAQVDGSGCPADSDSDGVANGIDRCPNTALGATVDPAGCPKDSDGDNIADGVDRCPETPAGVLVDPSGCPKDSDGDSIPDGLDRCSDTPQGATVDALGCPGDEDGDGVLDGLDRCPRTPAGAVVSPSGCPRGQPGRAPAAAPADSAPPQRAAPPPAPAPLAGAPMVLEGVTFGTGSARLQPGSYVELDSIAKVLLANPALRVEIGGHTDNAGSPADNQHLSTLRAEAVRNYLLAKGVPFQQVVARGYGATMPRTPDTTPRGRALNRRVELRPLPPGS